MGRWPDQSKSSLCVCVCMHVHGHILVNMSRAGVEDCGGVGCHQDMEGSEHQPTDFRLCLVSDREPF